MTFEEQTISIGQSSYYGELIKLVTKYNLSLGTVMRDFEHILFNIAGEDAEKALELQKDYYETKYSKENNK